MPSRMQLALNVNDLDESIGFYSKLFGTEPAKLRPGYANFAIAEPPLKLILMENPARAAASTTSASRSPTPARSTPSRQRLAGTGLAPPTSGRHHLLLRAAGQVLGPGHAQRRAVGDLHRPGGQPDLLGPGRHPERGSAEAR